MHPARLRWFVVLAAASLLFCEPGHTGDSIPGTNFNVATGSRPDQPSYDETYRQRQVEGTIVAPNRDPRAVVAAYVDYFRLPNAGDPTQASPVTFEAWIRFAISPDGIHFYQEPLPGFPGDTSAEGMASPARGMTTATDPVSATDHLGNVYTMFLAFIRGGSSKMCIARHSFLNNREGGLNAQYDFTRCFENGSNSPGTFVDKGWMATDPNRTPGAAVGACGSVYAAWTRFEGLERGSNPGEFRSSVYFTRSRDCGNNYDRPIRVDGAFTRNQGAAVLVNPANGNVHVVWRHFNQNMIMVATSTDGGARFGAPVPINPFGFPAYDQASDSSGASTIAFRTNAFPAGGMDGNGRAYIAWQQLVNGIPKIVMVSGFPSGQFQWSQPVVVAPGEDPQVLPQVVVAGGRVSVMYKSFPSQFLDSIKVSGSSLVADQVLTLLNNPFLSPNSSGIPAIAGRGRRQESRLVQTDVLPASAPVSAQVNFASSKATVLTQFLLRTHGQLVSPTGRLPQDDPTLSMYKGGYTAFNSDYDGLASAVTYVRTEPGSPLPWRHATEPTDAGAHRLLALFSSNRDAMHTGESPVERPTSFVFPWDTYNFTACTQPRSRDANEYFADVHPGIRAYAHVTFKRLTKPDGTPIVRAFPFTIENRSGEDRFFRLAAVAEDAVNLSFVESAIPGELFFNIQIKKQTALAWSVHASSSTNPTARFRVDVCEISDISQTACLASGLSGRILFNQDPTTPNPDTSVTTSETHNPIVSGGAVTAPIVSGGTPGAPIVSGPIVSGQSPSGPIVSGPIVSGPIVSGGSPSSPIVSGSAFDDSQVQSTSTSGTLTDTRDIVFTGQNAGNTNTSYNVFSQISNLNTLLAQGYKFQILLFRSYTTPGAVSPTNCAPPDTRLDEVISNITTPIVSGGATAPIVSGPIVSGPIVSGPIVSGPIVSGATYATAPSDGTVGQSSTDAFTALSAPAEVQNVTFAPHGEFDSVAANSVGIAVRVFTTPNTPSEGFPIAEPGDSVTGLIDVTVVSHAHNTGQAAGDPFPSSSTSLPPNPGANGTATSLTFGTNPVLVGQPTVMTVTVTDVGEPNAASSPTGVVTFSSSVLGDAFPPANCQLVPIASNASSCSRAVTPALPLGPHTFTANYAGNAAGSGIMPHSGSSTTAILTVKDNTTTVITSDAPDPSVIGTPYTVTFAVNGNTTGSGTPTGSVTVTDGAGEGSASCTAALSSGSGSCSLTSTSLGLKTLTATYTPAPGSFFNGSSDVEEHTVIKAATTLNITNISPSPSVVGQGTTVSYSMTWIGTEIGNPTGSVTVSDGSAGCSGPAGATGSCTFNPTSPGEKTVTASYPGDANFEGSSDTESLLVKANTATTITEVRFDPDPTDGNTTGVVTNSSPVNLAVKVSYSVSSPFTGTPTGSVVVSDGTGASCTGAAPSGDCVLTPASPGGTAGKSLTATYSGDGAFGGSVSSPKTHFVTGNVVVTGHDSDFHGAPGSTAAKDQLTAILAFVRRGSAQKILVFDEGTQLTNSLTAVGIPQCTGGATTNCWDNVNPAGAISDSLFNAATYSAIGVASDISCAPFGFGNCDNTQTAADNLEAKQSKFVDFFNSGGGIFVLSGAQRANYYKFLPLTACHINGGGAGDPQPQSTVYTQTAFGAQATVAIPAVNGDPTHNLFTLSGGIAGAGCVSNPTWGVVETYNDPNTVAVEAFLETLARGKK